MAAGKQLEGAVLHHLEDILRECYVDLKRDLNIEKAADLLFARGIIDYRLKIELGCVSEKRGHGSDANELFLQHLIQNGTLEDFKRFCDVLEESGVSELLPRHTSWAENLKKKLSEVSADRPMPQPPLQTEAEPTPTVSTIDERSKKVKEIVDMYRNGEGELLLPSNPDLEDAFDSVVGSLRGKLSSAGNPTLCQLQGMLQAKYRTYMHGVRPVPLPPVPDTVSGLCHFITEKSTPYEFLLVHHAAEALNDKDLKSHLQAYEGKLASHLTETLTSCKKRRVKLPVDRHRTHMAVVISKEQVLLSLVIHMKDYFAKYLQLEGALFEGFEEGCTVLFFSIQQVDTVLLAPQVLSRCEEMKKIFSVSHLVVFGYFAFDLGKSTMELLNADYGLSAHTSLELSRNSATKEAEVHKKHVAVLTEDKWKLKGDLEELENERAQLKEKMEKEKSELETKILSLENEVKQVQNDFNRHKGQQSLELQRVQSKLVHMSNTKLLAEMLKSDQKVFEGESLLNGIVLQSIQLPNLPIPTCHATALILGTKIYICGGVCADVSQAQLVQVYDANTAQWSTLPPTPTYDSEATLINGQLTLFGGRDVATGRIVSSTLTWDEEANQWCFRIPPMPRGRVRPCVIRCKHFVLVAGGKAADEQTILDVIDILNTHTSQWSTPSSIKLPQGMFSLRVSTTSSHVYITSCNIAESSATTTAYRMKVREMVAALTNAGTECKWVRMRNAPYCGPGLVMNSSLPVVIGGHKSTNATSNISVYSPHSRQWHGVGQCCLPHLVSCAAAVSSSSFVVVGGRTDPMEIKTSLINTFELFYVKVN